MCFSFFQIQDLSKTRSKNAFSQKDTFSFLFPIQMVSFKIRLILLLNKCIQQYVRKSDIRFETSEEKSNKKWFCNVRFIFESVMCDQVSTGSWPFNYAKLMQGRRKIISLERHAFHRLFISFSELFFILIGNN